MKISLQLLFFCLFFTFCSLSSKREGGLSFIELKQVVKYIRWIQHQPSAAWKSSIKILQKLINPNPVLRFNWNYGISLCKQTLPNKNSWNVLDLINKAIVTAPPFTSSPFIGFPINAILVQFMQTESGRSFFSQRSVNKIFYKILGQYHDMITSKASAKYLNAKSPYGWFSPQAYKLINYTEYQGSSSSSPIIKYKNWNEWFLRKFKNIGKTRPINADSPKGIKDQNIIVNACESIPLSNPIQPVRQAKKRNTFWLKDTPYSLKDMLADQKLAARFQGGTVYQAYLNAICYHRWHAPVTGTIERIYNIPGTYYYDQSQMFTELDPTSQDRSQPFLSSVATRLVIVIKTDNPRIGSVALIFIGMAQVSSCVATVKQGNHVRKGNQIGHFQFGGSSHVIIFQNKIKLKFNDRKLYKSKGNKFYGKKQKLRSYLTLVEQFIEKQTDLSFIQPNIIKVLKINQFVNIYR